MIIDARKIIKILKNIAFVFVLALMAITLFFTIQSKITGRNPTMFGYQLFTVQGSSMEPSIHKGSLAFIKYQNPSKLAVSDVITFITGNSVVTHRIVEIIKGDYISFITRGDANNANDLNSVSAQNVIGKVDKSIPYIGYFYSFAKSKAGLIALIIIPGVSVIIFELLKIRKQIIQNKINELDKVFIREEEALNKASDERSNAAI